MELAEVQKLNQLLAESTGTGQECKICVDTFRTPYIQWENPIKWPSLSVLEAEAKSAEIILKEIMQRSPWLLQGSQILPEARPRRDEPNLHLVKPFQVDDQLYLLKTKLLMTYMGGALGNEVEDRSIQDRNPAFESNRVYYQCRLFPVSFLKREQGALIDFEPRHYGPASGMQNTVGEAHQTARWNVMLFDEMDFSDLEQDIRERTSSQTWKPGRLFNPFVIDHGTVNWNVFHLKEISSCLPHFHRLWLHLKEGLDLKHEDHLFWDDYYASWKYSRFLSRGGNPHWEIVEAPGW
ncbi:MAG TPA: hypothetical protein DEA96_06450 [Leptospiraceae bacterium]|nr:hypothetical protein [Spirochaetaceae bacterium]HBS04584.1 hypothetical protein [Leptospiraceae bacterium]|tara:strand:+ start:187 stop:1068 length:882 start_codon:yes stop_codon:yes gene_type:complete